MRTEAAAGAGDSGSSLHFTAREALLSSCVASLADGVCSL